MNNISMLNMSSNPWQPNHPSPVIPAIIKAKTYHDRHEKYNYSLKMFIILMQKKNTQLNVFILKHKKNPRHTYTFPEINSYFLVKQDSINYARFKDNQITIQPVISIVQTQTYRHPSGLEFL
jgi:hypothetical protein